MHDSLTRYESKGWGIGADIRNDVGMSLLEGVSRSVSLPATDLPATSLSSTDPVVISRSRARHITVRLSGCGATDAATAPRAVMWRDAA